MDKKNGLQKVANLKIQMETPIGDPTGADKGQCMEDHGSLVLMDVAPNGIGEDKRGFTVLSFFTFNTYFTHFLICFTWKLILRLDEFNPFQSCLDSCTTDLVYSNAFTPMQICY